MEVGFDMCRVVVEKLCKGSFNSTGGLDGCWLTVVERYRCCVGGYWRSGGEDWVISPMVVGREETRGLLERPYVGTAGAAVPSLLLPALEMTGNSGERVVYGRVPCSCEGTLDAIHANVKSLLAFEGLMGEEKEAIGRHLEELFLGAAER